MMAHGMLSAKRRISFAEDLAAAEAASPVSLDDAAPAPFGDDDETTEDDGTTPGNGGDISCRTARSEETVAAFDPRRCSLPRHGHPFDRWSATAAETPRFASTAASNRRQPLWLRVRSAFRKPFHLTTSPSPHFKLEEAAAAGVKAAAAAATCDPTIFPVPTTSRRLLMLLAACACAAAAGPFFFNWSATQSSLLQAESFAWLCTTGDPEGTEEDTQQTTLPLAFSQEASPVLSMLSSGGIFILPAEGSTAASATAALVVPLPAAKTEAATANKHEDAALFTADNVAPAPPSLHLIPPSLLVGSNLQHVVLSPLSLALRRPAASRRLLAGLTREVAAAAAAAAAKRGRAAAAAAAAVPAGVWAGDGPSLTRGRRRVLWSSPRSVSGNGFPVGSLALLQRRRLLEQEVGGDVKVQQLQQPGLEQQSTAVAAPCRAQVRAVNSLMPVGVASWFAWALVGGVLSDLRGARWCVFAGLAAAAAGWLILSLCGGRFPAYGVAFAVIGAASDVIFIPLLGFVSSLFSKRRGLALAGLNASRSLAYQVPNIHLAMGGWVALETTAAAHALWLAALAAVVHAVVPAAVDEYKGPRRSMAFMAADSVDAPSAVDAMMMGGAQKQEQQQQQLRHSVGDAVEQSWVDATGLQCVLSSQFMALLPIAVIVVVRSTFLANSAPDQMGDLSRTFVTLTSCSLLLCPLLGMLVDWAGTRAVFLLTNTAAVLQFGLLSFCSQWRAALLVVAICNPVVTAFFVGQFYCHIMQHFGVERSGSLIGIAVALSGPAGLLVTPMFSYSTTVGSFIPMNRVCLAAGLLCYPLIWALESTPGNSKFTSSPPQLLLPRKPVPPPASSPPQKKNDKQQQQQQRAATTTATSDEIPLTPTIY